MVILLRHGATPENDAKPEILRGTDDSPLSDRGRREIQRAAEEICYYPVVEVRSDRYLRDWQSGEIIAAACGNVPLVLSTELEPYNIGILSGQVKEKVWPIIKFLLTNPDVAAPGGESSGQFITDFENYWWQVYDEYGGRDDLAVVLVLHGTEFRALNSILYRLPMPLNYEEHVKTGEVLVVQ